MYRVLNNLLLPLRFFLFCLLSLLILELLFGPYGRTRAIDFSIIIADLAFRRLDFYVCMAEE